MDLSSSSGPRVSYGFPRGTFDLRSVRPDVCFPRSSDHAEIIPLDGDWRGIFAGLRQVRGLLASVGSGPVNLVETLTRPDFLPVPGMDRLLEVESGVEVCPRGLGQAYAAVERTADGSELAGIQFFDQADNGLAKFFVTNLSRTAAFEELVERHGCRRGPVGGAAPEKGEEILPAVSLAPDVGAVRNLWAGMRRTLPGREFPGLAGVTRLQALRAAGPGYAWSVTPDRVLNALAEFSGNGAALHGTVTNGAFTLSSVLPVTHWQPCCCGTTFFGTRGQFTHRRGTMMDLWVTRQETPAGEELTVEYYDAAGAFRGAVSPHTDSPAAPAAWWREWLFAQAAG